MNCDALRHRTKRKKTQRKFLFRKQRQDKLSQLQGQKGISRTEAPRTSDNNKIEKRSVPETVCFMKNRDETLSFFRDIRESADGQSLLRLNLKKLKYISPEASLVYVAEMDRNRLIKDSQIYLFGTKRWSEEIKVQFNEIGMFELLKIRIPSEIKRYRENNANKGIKFLKFISGEAFEESETAIVDSLSALFDIKLMSGKKHLQIGLGEAIINVIHHAYREEFLDANMQKYKKWCVSASFDYDTSILTFMIYDQGATIPTTLDVGKLNKKGLFKIFGNIFDKDYDNHLVKAAVETDKSSTLQSYRGKGLKDIKKYAENVNNGELMIISRKGFYLYARNKKTITEELPIPLQGTLICWKGCMDGSNIDATVYKK